MSFHRKRDLTKKQVLEEQSTMLSDLQSTNPSEISQQDTLTFHRSMEKLAHLSDHLADMQPQAWQRESSSILGFFLDSQRRLLINQQFAAYKESMVMIVKYQQELKRQGKQLTEENGSLTLGIYKKILDELVRITKEPRNEHATVEAALVQPIFANLEAFVSHLEAESSKTQKRPALMRKNSLKKVQELPAVRPLSRGKLSSLTKKDPMNLKKQEIVAANKPKQEYAGQKSCIEDVVIAVCSLANNLSVIAKLRREMLQEEYLRLINRYLCVWTERNLSNAGGSILIQLMSCIRHLAVEQKSYRIFLDSNCLQNWARIIEIFPTNQTLIFNILRTLSKLSNYQSCCVKLNEKKSCIKTLSSFFKFYKSDIHIVVRVAVIFANMTSYLSDIRNQLYFDLQAWRDIYECFDYYANRELSGKSEVDKMGVSMAAWDRQFMEKESDIDCTIRIVRLIANLFTVAPIGQDIYMNQPQIYRDLVSKLKSLLEKKCSIDRWGEVIATILSCLTNILFYDKELLMTNVEHKMVKNQLVHTLVDFVVQIDNEEICCESLRVVANLTRIKEFCGIVIEAKIHEALLILLESTSKEIVYYCLGVLSNLMADNNFKQTYKEIIVSGVISILKECDNDDFDVVTVALKTLSTIVDSRNENLDPKLMADVEACLMGLGGHCDKALSKPGGEVAEVVESRTLINMLLNNMPEQKFICPIRDCGRKFADDAKLQDHVKRRHKI